MTMLTMNQSSLARDRRGASALEFAIVALPFLLLVFTIIQMGIYYMTQTALDAGVNTEAIALQNNFNLQTATVPSSAAAVKAAIVAGSGSLIFTSGTQFEIQQLSNYTSQNQAIVDGTMNFTNPNTTYAILVLRAQSSVIQLAPGFGSSVVESTAIIRRQGY